MSELPLQRRFERQVVRFQARLEAGVGDRWIPTVVTAALAVVMIRSGLSRLAGYGTGIDLAGYTQSIWLLSDGKVPKASLFGTDVHLLELHFSFIMYPLGLVSLVAPAAQVLIYAQGAALGLAVLPLWRLARRVAHLRVGAATALVLAYALHPATHRLGTQDFHPESLAVPALIGMAYFGATKGWIPYWLCIAAALACRADLGLVVALWGFVALGHRERSVGVWTLGVGLVWSLGLLLVVQPLFGQGVVTEGYFGFDGSYLGEDVLGAMRQPLSTIQDLVAEDNITLVVGLLAPVIFLPLLSLRHLAPAFPVAVLYLVADLSPEVAFAERAAMLLAFVMIAATYALNRLGHMGVDRVFLDARILSTLVAASVLLFVSSSTISPYQEPWNWDRLEEPDRALGEAIALLDDEVTVRASPSALAHLAERPWLFAVDPRREPTAAQAGFPRFTRAVLVDERQVPPRTNSEREQFDRGMVSQGFELVFDRAGIALYQRDASSAEAVVPG